MESLAVPYATVVPTRSTLDELEEKFQTNKRLIEEHLKDKKDMRYKTLCVLITAAVTAVIGTHPTEPFARNSSFTFSRQRWLIFYIARRVKRGARRIPYKTIGGWFDNMHYTAVRSGHRTITGQLSHQVSLGTVTMTIADILALSIRILEGKIVIEEHELCKR